MAAERAAQVEVEQELAERVLELVERELAQAVPELAVLGLAQREAVVLAAVAIRPVPRSAPAAIKSTRRWTQPGSPADA